MTVPKQDLLHLLQSDFFQTCSNLSYFPPLACNSHSDCKTGEGIEACNLFCNIFTGKCVECNGYFFIECLGMSFFFPLLTILISQHFYQNCTTCSMFYKKHVLETLVIFLEKIRKKLAALKKIRNIFFRIQVKNF